MEKERAAIVELFLKGKTQSEIMKLLKIPETRRKLIFRTINGLMRLAVYWTGLGVVVLFSQFLLCECERLCGVGCCEILGDLSEKWLRNLRFLVDCFIISKRKTCDSLHIREEKFTPLQSQ